MAIDKQIENILSQILNPEYLGNVASPALRDSIRFALGRHPVESNLVAFFCTDADTVSMKRLHNMALAAKAEYDHGIRTGGEPHYPAWAYDVIKLIALFSTDQAGAVTAQNAAPTDKDAVDADRWRTALRFVAAYSHGDWNKRFHFGSLPFENGTTLLRSSVADHFTKAIDDARTLQSQSQQVAAKGQS